VHFAASCGCDAILAAIGLTVVVVPPRVAPTVLVDDGVGLELVAPEVVVFEGVVVVCGLPCVAVTAACPPPCS
jgi:hypothetical protein